MTEGANKRFGHYIIEQELGQGSFAVVYRATNTKFNRTEALKLLKKERISSPAEVDAFLREARTAGALSHPRITTFYDTGEIEGQPYIAMEFVPGSDLGRLIAARGKLSWQEGLTITLQVCEALAYAHAEGRVHGDIKPSNILVSPRKGAVLSDFGMGRLVNADRTGSSFTVRGTPAYIPPEVWDGLPTGPAADQYALACVLAEMLTGAALFQGSTPWAVMKQHSLPPNLPQAWPSGAPVGLNVVLQKALAPTPAGRYPSMEDFARALQQAQGEEDRRQAEWQEQQRLQAEQKARAAQLLAEAPRAAPTRMNAAQSKTNTLPRKGLLWGAGLLAALGLVLLITLAVQNAAESSARATVTSPPTLAPGVTQVWPKDGMVLVYVPAGEFLMGSTDADKDAFSSEKPQHAVYLDAFWIDQHEVTNAMYKICVAEGKCASRQVFGGDNHPQVYANWNDAKAYCEWAGRQLPSEAQWEKAARGTDGRLYPWGNQVPDDTYLNYNQNLGGTIAVKSYENGKSPYGAYDMAGNVWEWVADWYSETTYSSQSTWRNPTGPSSGTARVLRGGSWFNGSWNSRATYRNRVEPSSTVNYFGFRCAR